MMEDNAYQETHRTWNKVAALYQEKFMGLDLYNETYDSFITLLPPSASIIEVGCGPGNISNYLSRKDPTINVLLTDVSPEMIKLAGKNNPGAKCQLMDARDLGKTLLKFDGIVAGFCLPYLSLEDSKKFFLDAFNVLRENGRIYVSILSGDYVRSGFESGNYGRVYVYYYTEEQLGEMLAEAGLKVLYQKKLFFERNNNTETHHVLIAGK